MTRKVAESRQGDQVRPRVTAPHIPLSTLRRRLRLRLDDVCDRIAEQTGIRPERSSISAIENGLRGASVEMLRALAEAYDIDPRLIDTDYPPRHQHGAAE